MRDPDQHGEHSARTVVTGVTRKTALLTAAGAVAALALQLTIRPDLPVWVMPAGVTVGGALGAVNFRWLAYAVERVYLKQGSTSLLSNIAAAIISILKLSVIFIVLFIVIKWNVVHLLGLVSGLSLCFLAILWQGFGVLTDGVKQNH
ncbi:MAG: hypothetical protein OEW15_11055 [Nitrospirota bacterium]|nr:hypothetical protein [Nitrospirota bacterium]